MKPISNKNSHSPRLHLALWILILLSFCPVLHAEESVIIKILAVNPSDTKKLDASISHYLPPEVHPEDVIDKAGMDIQYDRDKKTYFLTGKVELNPKETKTIAIKVKNVWVVSDEALAKTRGELTQGLTALKGTEYEETAKKIAEKITERITSIEEEKSKAVGMRQRVELYRSHVKQLQGIEKDMLSIGSLRRLKLAGTEGVRTAKFLIVAENPLDEQKQMTVRADLPKEIGAEDVLDKQGFLLLFSADDNHYTLEKQDLLQAKEKRKYEITLRDIWYIPKEKLDVIQKQIETLAGHFKDSQYESFAQTHIDFITQTIEQIDTLQNEVASSSVLDDRIRAFTLNMSRLDLINQKMRDLQDLLLEIPMKRSESVTEQIRKAVKSLAHIIDIIKLGFTPDLSTTWWIILGIIAFLFIMSASFYVIWVSKLKDAKVIKKGKDGGKKGPGNAPQANVPVQGAGAK